MGASCGLEAGWWSVPLGSPPVLATGLHGFLWGEGDGGLASLGSRCRVDDRQGAGGGSVIPDNNDKVKFPRGEVILCGIAWR